MDHISPELMKSILDSFPKAFYFRSTLPSQWNQLPVHEFSISSYMPLSAMPKDELLTVWRRNINILMTELNLKQSALDGSELYRDDWDSYYFQINRQIKTLGGTLPWRVVLSKVY